MVAVYILLYILIVFNYTAYVGQECVTITGRRTDGHTKTLPKPIREAAIEHAKEITQQDMSDSLDRGKKGKKKRKKNPLIYSIWDLRNSVIQAIQLLIIHIEFSAKEPSAADRRFADVIRSVLL